MTQKKIKIYNDPESDIWQVVGDDAKNVWDALGIFEIFKADEETFQQVNVKEENLDKFINGMREKYNIEVKKVYVENYLPQTEC